MLNPFKKKTATPPPPPPPDAPGIQDTLFGDVPLDHWPPSNVPANAPEPWASFIAARDALAQGDPASARSAWQRITLMPDLESRHYAQAWHFLRAHGITPPPEKAKQLLGVILEVPMQGGLDLLAAYPERTARYYNYSGAAVIWDHPNDSLDPLITDLLQAAQGILNTIGPWDAPRRTHLHPKYLRISLLAPSGLHFGEGPFEDLSTDPLAKPTFDAATRLMVALTSLPKRT